MSTDDEKQKISKLLQGLEVPDVKLTERCSGLVKDFHEKYDKEIEEAEPSLDMTDLCSENPYKPPQEELDEITRKLKELIQQSKRCTEVISSDVTAPVTDPKRPWRTHSNKERLLRVNNELKRHHEMGSQCIVPLEDTVIKSLIQEGEEVNRSSPAVPGEKLRDVVDSAKRNLPNFQYKNLENSTATSILPSAHEAPNSTPHKEDSLPPTITTIQ
ncbi:hypothetical protein NE865_10860 [Phthorimaea operculella]|nr:hypothetical protein NE865_10860 [Phthorimaea operculella]